MSVLLILKSVHVFCVMISASLFVYRYLHLRRYPEQELPRQLRILPHVNDTILLAAAVGMVIVLQLNPLSTAWLLAKILALIAYIGLGTICLKALPGSQRQSVFFVLAILTYAFIVIVALSKRTLFW